MLLKELDVKGLYGSYNYNVKFNDDVTLIYGMNGCGKTTILNITEAIITGAVFRLFEYLFTKITLSYSTNSNEEIKKIVISNKEKVLTVNFNGESENIELISFSEREMLADPDYNDFLRLYFNRYNILCKIKSTFNHAYLPLNRSFNYADEYELRRFRKNLWRHIKFEEIASERDIIMYKVEDLIRRKYSDIFSSIGKYNDEFRNEILKSLLTIKESNSLSEVLNEIANKRIEDNEINRIKENYIKILQQLNILKNDEEKTYKNFFDGFLKEYNIWKKNKRDLGLPTSLASQYTEIQRIKKLVKIAEKTEQRKNEAYKPIDVFVSTINDFIYSEIDQKRIHITNGEIYFTTGNNDTKIKIHSLSSGEKQLVIFFASLIFEIQKESTGIFIVDEPELSLHLSWQKVFIKKALETNQNIQLIFATHSPEIVGKFRDKMYRLEKESASKESRNYE